MVNIVVCLCYLGLIDARGESISRTCLASLVYLPPHRWCLNIRETSLPVHRTAASQTPSHRSPARSPATLLFSRSYVFAFQQSVFLSCMQTHTLSTSLVFCLYEKKFNPHVSLCVNHKFRRSLSCCWTTHRSFLVQEICNMGFQIRAKAF
jgi:hypothetical protein